MSGQKRKPAFGSIAVTRPHGLKISGNGPLADLKSELPQFSVDLLAKEKPSRVTRRQSPACIQMVSRSPCIKSWMGKNFTAFTKFTSAVSGDRGNEIKLRRSKTENHSSLFFSLVNLVMMVIVWVFLRLRLTNSFNHQWDRSETDRATGGESPLRPRPERQFGIIPECPFAALTRRERALQINTVEPLATVG